MSFCNNIVNEIKFYFNLKGSYLILGIFFLYLSLKRFIMGLSCSFGNIENICIREFKKRFKKEYFDII